MPPSFFSDAGKRRIVFQLWDWLDDRRYTVHLHITRQTDQGWKDYHFVGHYRAMSPEEVFSLVVTAGFADVRVLPSTDTGFYQPIITAVRP